ncbi:MAG: class II aldolase/adducin family protein [Rhodothermales bacterium]|nr:class II aldolase/adducin family protein [Rhodothermales bacterium]
MAQEGVIKYQLWFLERPPLPAEALSGIDAWRRLLFQTGLIGQDPARYGGYGYGNVSVRVPPLEAPPTWRRFAISATQTGGLPVLGPEHYALVRGCYPAENLIVAEGPGLPSSEALTHGVLYALDAGVRAVLHVHSPALWHAAAPLGLPVTRPDVPYGTPEMAGEVARLFAETDVRQRRLFAMGGHEDGLVAFGATAEEAGTVLLAALARALAHAAAP